MRVRMHRLTLAFEDAALEAAYLLARRKKHSRRWTALSILLLALLWGMSIPVLCLVLPGDRRVLGLVLGIPLGYLTIALAATRFLFRFVRVAVPWMALGCGVAIILVQAILGERFAPYAAVGMAVHLLGVHAFTDQRFIHTAA